MWYISDMPKTTKRWWVGHKAGALVAFRCELEPTRETHGKQFPAVIGPFRTARAAKWAERYGLYNPHFRCVDDAERIAAKYAKVEPKRT